MVHSSHHLIFMSNQLKRYLDTGVNHNKVHVMFLEREALSLSLKAIQSHLIHILQQNRYYHLINWHQFPQTLSQASPGAAFGPSRKFWFPCMLLGPGSGGPFGPLTFLGFVLIPNSRNTNLASSPYNIPERSKSCRKSHHETVQLSRNTTDRK